MKPHPNNLKVVLIVLATILMGGQVAQTQDPYTGAWEGTFMQDFHTAILLEATDNGAYKGKILMYSGQSRIQDDELSKISIENRTLRFYIAAKETSFQGIFNEELSELSGKFIFPDDSEHSLVVRKKTKDDSAEASPKPSPMNQIREKIPVDELKSDLQYLINKLKQYHPRLYSYTSEDAFSEKASRIYADLNHDMTPEEFYLQIAPLVAAVKCSHTGIRLPPVYQELLFAQTNYLPLDIYIIGEKAYTLSGYGPEEMGLVPGTQILSVNQRSSGQIIEELLGIIPAEGNRQTTKYQVINKNFHTYFHLLDRSQSFEIIYGNAADHHATVIEACKYSELRKERLIEKLSPALFRIERNPDVGILEVNTFAIRDMDAYFALLDSAFQELERKNIPYLVLDLRDNKGGHPIFAAQLLSYLVDEEFTYFQRNQQVSDFEPLYNSMPPNVHHYKGNLYVMVNGLCMSTTGHLISLLKYHTRAKFIGEEPGSTFLCNDFSTQITLPHSGMEVNIPRTTFITDVKGFNDGRLFAVDYQVQNSVQDLLKDRDPYLAYFKSLISLKEP